MLSHVSVLHFFLWLNIYTYLCVYMFVCVYIYIYLCLYIYTHTHTQPTICLSTHLVMDIWVISTYVYVE